MQRIIKERKNILILIKKNIKKAIKFIIIYKNSSNLVIKIAKFIPTNDYLKNKIKLSIIYISSTFYIYNTIFFIRNFVIVHLFDPYIHVIEL